MRGLPYSASKPVPRVLRVRVTLRGLLMAGTVIVAGSVGAKSVGAANPYETRQYANEFCDRQTDDCTAIIRGAHQDSSSVEYTLIPDPNTEQTPRSRDAIPFRISVDGQPMAVSVPDGVLPAPAVDVEDGQRIEDLRLEAVDIQVKFDGLDITPYLNVSTRPAQHHFAPGDTVEFYGNWNYPDWIVSREVRITDSNGDLVASIPMSAAGEASWSAQYQAERPGRYATADTVGERIGDDVALDGTARYSATDGFGSAYEYTLRVYDSKGRFDETIPLPLKVSEKANELRDVGVETGYRTPVPGEGEDRTAVRNIQLGGGAVTVYGRHIPEGHTVTVFGRTIPLGVERDFVTQRILTAGPHSVDVKVYSPDGTGLEFSRDISIPENDWFYVGLADLAVGRNFDSYNRVEGIEEDERNRFYTRGRAAAYVKGKIQGKYLLTAAFDTGDEELSELFRNLDEKDPRRLLRRIDPDDYYPVYGDDSTTLEDAPTRGKFYVRLERDDSHVMWGNFKTRITGTEFARHERGLYGAHGLYRSPETTSYGERRVKVHAFAAEPGTIPQRDEFRATGGSAFFLRRQDITVGSEQVTIDIRDRVTGLSKSRRTLRPEQDYDIDFVQGVLILREPLASTAAAGELVRDTQVGGDPVFVLVNYEYTPVTGDFDDYSIGTRTQVWLTDNLRLGASAYSEEQSGEDQLLVEGDATLRVGEHSFVELEGAFSEGDGFGETSSVDGGFRFVDQASPRPDDDRAIALRAKAALDLRDINPDALPGKVGVHVEHREQGFSGLDRLTNEETTIYGAFADLDLREDTSLAGRYDSVEVGDNEKREGSLQVTHRLNERWSAQVGGTYSDTDGDTVSGFDDGDGERLDVGARVTYEQPRYKLYGWGQVTVIKDGDREDNHRVGIGAEADLTDRLSAKAEVSVGSLGFGALAGLNYAPTVDQNYYFGYRLDGDRTDGDLDAYDPFGRDTGSFVFGAKRQINESLSVYGEENFDLIGERQSLTHAYGVTYTPDDRWRFHGSVESGQFDDDRGDDFKRHALSAGADYAAEGVRAAVRGEVRLEDSEDNERQDRETYLFSSNTAYTVDPEWRVLSHVDAVVSNSDESAFLDGDYIEASIGAAYRPVTNDRFNALARYTFFYDLPGPEQVNAEGDVLGPRQRSHIVSVDGTYDVNPYISVGGKYGFRYGKISESRVGGGFTKSTAHLGIARLDLHVVKNWDAVVEGRVLHLPEAESTRWGFFGAVYRHFGDNLKLGVGYNFADFSDDLTDVTFDDEGVFVNVIAKF